MPAKPAPRGPYPKPAAAERPRLRITEIFHSIQGEASTVGVPTVFVRLTGCPLRCSYCDTEYAFTGGHWMALEDIMDAVAPFGARYVCVTGGEPLAQKHCIELLQRLCDAGYDVSLETSGALDISVVDTRVSRVLDIKTPGSGECARNRLENLDRLTPRDQVKFVLADRKDFEWARDLVIARSINARCQVLFSPVYRRLEPRELAEWILAERLPVRLQIQLHKLLWGERPGV